MERLSGLDAFFLYVESPAMHTHVALTAVFDPSTTPGGYSFERFRDHIAQRVHLVAPFRRRVVEVPLRLHHPVWVDDAGFRVDRHVKRAAVPAPGNERQLATLVGHLASIPLDRDLPLWEMWVIEGLADGRIGLVAKIHHSAMDGAGGAEILPIFFDLEPDPPATGGAPAFTPHDPPSSWELLGMAGVQRARAIGQLPRLARRTGEAIGLIRRRRGQGIPSGGTPLSVPRTRFNGRITADRSVAFARISLADVKRVKQAFDATVNDVLLATTALATRRYLADHGEAPTLPLVAACPVSIRTEDDRGRAANRLSVMFTQLHAELDDPATVLETTRTAARAAKEEHAILGDDILTSWAEVADPLASSVGAHVYHRVGASNRHRPAISLILSNIPGPPFPVYLAGAEMERAFPFGPILDGAGLNVTVLSYRDSVDFGFLAATALVPDVWDLADAVGGAFADLLEAAETGPDLRSPAIV